MTIQTDIIFPLRPADIKEGGAHLERYMRDLVKSLTDMYQDVAKNVNGSLQQWTPIIVGATTPGTGTYTRQVGWYLRSGIMTDVWMDVAWSAHTGTGALNIQMPYESASSEGSPWIGVIESSTLTLSAGNTWLVWKFDPDLFVSKIVQCGSGIASTVVNMQSSGRLVGHIRFVGKENENG